MRPAASVGTEIGGYRIEERLGGGAMGVVYRAEEVRLGRRVALKLLASDLAEDEGFRERFLRESRLAAAIDHPHIIPIYRAGEEDGLLYLAMRHVEGPDLKALLAAETRLAPGRALAILDQVADALDIAHENGLVHRDVKPANILIASRGGRDHCYLTDFGLAKSTGRYSGLTAAGEILGTLNYVAPEQIEGKPLDGRADLYSLGCVLFECLTGVAPYARDSEAALLWAHLREPPPAPSKERPELPERFDAVVAKALAKPPDGRYSTCGLLAADARAALGREPLTASTERVPERSRLQSLTRARWARPWVAAAAAVVLAVAAVFLGSTTGSTDSASRPTAGAVSGQILAPVLAADRALTDRILSLTGTGPSLRRTRPGIRADAAALFAAVSKAQKAAGSAALPPGNERVRQRLQLALSDHGVHARATQRAAQNPPTYFDIWAVISTAERVSSAYQELRQAAPGLGRPLELRRAAKRLLDASAPHPAGLEPGVRLGPEGYRLDPEYARRYVRGVDALGLRALRNGILALVVEFQNESIRYDEASRRIRELISRYNAIKLEVALTPEPRLSTGDNPGPAVLPSPLLLELVDASLEQALAAQSWMIAANSGDPDAGSYHSAYLDAGHRATERESAFFLDFARLRRRTETP